MPNVQDEHKIYVSQYKFTLIDFGMMSRFKVNKTRFHYDKVCGNLMFASYRSLKLEQIRFQDDVESLVSLVFYMIKNSLPWNEVFEDQIQQEDYTMDQKILLYRQLRINNHSKFQNEIV